MSKFSIENTEQLEIFSKEINQKFLINVGFPPNYSIENKKYPVVYVTDAGANFGGLMSSLPLMQLVNDCLLYTSPSPRDVSLSRMPSSA